MAKKSTTTKATKAAVQDVEEAPQFDSNLEQNTQEMIQEVIDKPEPEVKPTPISQAKKLNLGDVFIHRMSSEPNSRYEVRQYRLTGSKIIARSISKDKAASIAQNLSGRVIEA